MSETRQHRNSPRSRGWGLLAFGALWICGVALMTPKANAPGPNAFPEYVPGIFCLVCGFSILAQQRSLRWWAVAATLALVSMYGVVYISLGNRWEAQNYVVRDFPSRVIARAFVPLGWIESRFSQRPVQHRWPIDNIDDGKRGRIFKP